MNHILQFIKNADSHDRIFLSIGALISIICIILMIFFKQACSSPLSPGYCENDGIIVLAVYVIGALLLTWIKKSTGPAAHIIGNTQEYFFAYIGTLLVITAIPVIVTKILLVFF